MKKYMAFVVWGCILSTQYSFAQNFEPQVKINFAYGADSYQNLNLGGEFLAGFIVNQNVRIGIGAGIDYCDHLYESKHYDYILNIYDDEYRETAAFVPVFLNGKYNFTDSDISPYISADLGYSLFIPFSDYAKDNTLGVFAKPSFGIDFNVGKGDIFVEINYNYQTRKFHSNCNYSQIGISIGYQF